MDIGIEDIVFTVNYGDEEIDLTGQVFRPRNFEEKSNSLPPIVFNSGFAGGVSMYGQLFGRALAERGYCVMTYDVAGFYTNKHARNIVQQGDLTLTNVSLEDQKDEVLGAIAWTQKTFGRMPAVVSWAMGGTASLAAIAQLARAGGPQVAFYAPLNYTRISSLQNLRADKAAAHASLMALADDDAIPPFDTGTQKTRLGFYPLDTDTQAYVDEQLGAYTEAASVERWPGCSHMTASSYKDYVAFDPEAGLNGSAGFPPALIVHGADNTLHLPEEAVHLHGVYPGDATDGPYIIGGMAHGQQNQPDNAIFRQMIDQIDRNIATRAA